MTEQYLDALTLAYGPFQPGTVARAIRHEHAALGLRTCWHCIRPFKPRRYVDDDGRLHRVGRGRMYCSTGCARAARRNRREQQGAREQRASAHSGHLGADLHGGVNKIEERR